MGTIHLVRYTGKFVIPGVRYIGIPLYFNLNLFQQMSGEITLI